ncbi:hypothetical protein PHMEG_00022715 [Phytophthora megakarya]|uniref:Ribonuclease H n=1 Tax=Phytophthora megakarya TaxID=4795 RepID=A0A225UGM4_9STRA|nr:hypothetical protein PHMEG_00038940 [Phytophthora megakarya]OWZ05235.1 hypothetical protein PHMEG_00022715 [Phytophthora megakarya]
MPKGKGGYYAVASGRETGVYKSWDSAKAQTNGYSNNQHQRFDTQAEANAYMAGYNGGTGKGGNPPLRE